VVGATDGRLAGRVAFVTGAGRGQGRSHAIRLAEEGAHIIAVDVLEDMPTCDYPMATQADLDETVRLVAQTGREIVACQADVRDQTSLDVAVAEGVERFGRLDIVCANAGIRAVRNKAWEFSEAEWTEMIDINLNGVWRTTKAAIPAMVEGDGGSIVLTSSAVSKKAWPNLGAYTAAKNGVVGIMRTLALELAEHNIRVNSVHPSSVPTPMLLQEGIYKLLRPDLENPTLADCETVFRSMQLLPVPWVESVDVSNAIVWLCSDEARYITGVELPVDAGNTII
jgi:(+)-trans-carveol dehydrogenase